VLFTFPSRYWFTIGRRHVFSLGRWSSRFPAGFHVSRGTQEPDRRASLLSPTGLSPCIADPFLGRSARKLVSDSPASLQRRHVRPYNPADTTPAGLTYRRFGLFPVRSPLLGESRLLSLPPGTEMVHFPGLAAPPYEFRWRARGLPSRGFPIRKSSGRSLFAAHRGLSQLTASFVAVLRQGIHRTPLVA
jgi:hypothetical protein